jgi:hypothetical protein
MNWNDFFDKVYKNKDTIIQVKCSYELNEGLCQYSIVCITDNDAFYYSSKDSLKESSSSSIKEIYYNLYIHLRALLSMVPFFKNLKDIFFECNDEGVSYPHLERFFSGIPEEVRLNLAYFHTEPSTKIYEQINSHELISNGLMKPKIYLLNTCCNSDYYHLLDSYGEILGDLLCPDCFNSINGSSFNVDVRVVDVKVIDE